MARRCRRVPGGLGRDARNRRMSMALVIDLPPSETLRPDQAVGELAKLEWQEVIGIGITAEGEFEVINSAMTAERALWLIEWAKHWAMGLAIDEYRQKGRGEMVVWRKRGRPKLDRPDRDTGTPELQARRAALVGGG